MRYTEPAVYKLILFMEIKTRGHCMPLISDTETLYDNRHHDVPGNTNKPVVYVESTYAKLTKLCCSNYTCAQTSKCQLAHTHTCLLYTSRCV